jgi:rhamnopyranosyl-N-acetylglucosaminyl-diphospho-decaprenol beta-1,3/1,4-galactofuranosyltransferase
MSGSVCAVVVTFNRKDLLPGCLTALRSQTRPLDQILVVNNHSTDGTEILLGAEFADLPALHLVENRGGAGGFQAGMQWAYEQGHEWIWVMDDDIVPYPGTLEMMLQYEDLSHFIHSRREWPDGVINSLEAIWDLSSCSPINYGNDLSFEGNDRPWISVNYANFEGALVNRSVIDKIGYPDPRFFIFADDIVYGLLASFHTNVLYLRAVGFHKALPRPAQKARHRLMYYVMIRNRFLLREHLRKKGAMVNSRVFWFSQLLLVAWALKDAASGFKPGWKTNVAAVLGGFRDGARGRFGRPPWLPA